MDEFKVFPSSLNLSSGIYYVCGVDVCEERSQFCSVIHRRCEYCTDHHFDCFTYIQQQNCTQYCQDQWLMNQLEKQSLIRGMNIPQSQEYKILSIVFGILWFLTIISMLFCVARIRQWFRKTLLPGNITRKRSKDTNARIRHQRSINGSGIEDLEAMERMEIRNDILEQSQQKELNKGRKSNNAKVYNHFESPETIYENFPSPENDAKMNGNFGNRKDFYKTSGDFSQEEKKTNGFMEREVNTKYKTEEMESKQDFQVFKEHNKAIPPKSNDISQENGIQTCSLHGELSTMSSHGDYHAMVPFSYNSSDNENVIL